MGSIEVLERKLNTLKRQESLSEEKIVEKREEIAERQIIKDRAQLIDIIKIFVPLVLDLSLKSLKNQTFLNIRQGKEKLCIFGFIWCSS